VKRADAYFRKRSITIIQERKKRKSNKRFNECFNVIRAKKRGSAMVPEKKGGLYFCGKRKELCRENAWKPSEKTQNVAENHPIKVQGRKGP